MTRKIHHQASAREVAEFWPECGAAQSTVALLAVTERVTDGRITRPPESFLTRYGDNQIKPNCQLVGAIFQVRPFIAFDVIGRGDRARPAPFHVGPG